MTKPPDWFKKIYTEAWPMIQAHQRKATTMPQDDYVGLLQRRLIGVNEELQRALDTCKRMGEDNQRLIKDHAKEARTAVETIERLGQQIGKLRQDYKVLQSHREKLAKDANEMEAQNVDLKERLEVLEAQLADAQNIAAKHAEESNRLDKALRDKDRDLANHKQTLTERDTDLAEVRQKLHEAEAAKRIQEDALDRIENYALAPIRPERSDQDSVLEYVDDILQRLSNCHEAAKRAQLEPIEEPEPDAQG